MNGWLREKKRKREKVNNLITLVTHHSLVGAKPYYLITAANNKVIRLNKTFVWFITKVIRLFANDRLLIFEIIRANPSHSCHPCSKKAELKITLHI